MSWPNVTLETVCKKITDGSHNPPKGVQSSEYLMLSSQNVFHNHINFENPRYLTKEDFEQENKRTDVSVNDVLLTIVGTVGRVAVVSPELPKLTLQRSVAVLKPSTEYITPRFLMYSLQNISEHLIAESRGVAQKGIYLKQIRELNIPLPSLAEQQKIAAILDAADSLRQKDQQLVKRYTALSQSLFMEMFGRLELLPSMPLKQVSKFIDYRGKTPSKTESGIPLLTAKNIKVGYVSEQPREFISMNSYKEWMTRGFPKEGDILFTTEAPLGQAALLPKYDAVAIAQRLICIQPFKGLNSHFLMYVFFSEFFKRQLFNRATGSTVKGVRSKELAKISIPLPQIALQNQFAERIKLIEAQKQQAQHSLEKSEALFNSLLQRAFTSELTAKMAA